MKRALVVEDNVYSGEIIEKVILEADKSVEVLRADNIRDAYKCSMDYSIDFFIVDIVLDSKKANDVSGLDFARRIRSMVKYKMTPLIFVSSKQVAKLDLFQSIHCYSILEKPICDNELRQLIENICCKNICNIEDDCIDFRVNGVIFPISISKIVYIEYRRGVLKVYTTTDILRVPYYSLKEIERRVGNLFLRCSRNFLVNRQYIYEIDLVNRFVDLIDGYGKLEIGSVMKKRIRKEFGNGL